MEENNLVEWNSGLMLEVTLAEPDDFLKVKETLTRIGIASRRDNKLFQSCHILHKQGRYFIVHFKELFCLDGKTSTISGNDLERRNRIVHLLDEWNLIKIVKPEVFSEYATLAPMTQIKIIPYKQRDEWTLQPKYDIGKKTN